MTMWRKHDFFHLMASVRAEIAHDYKIVKMRSRDDPGTAGDQVEEQWAGILRKWLPATYPVITKGRILFEDQDSSPQVDVLVLKPSYPIALRDQKYIFSGGVLAAFECKLTLRSRDISDAFRNCSKIKRKARHNFGTPQDELCRLPIFGILAHSHDIKAKNGDSRLYEHIERAQNKYAEHLSELIDIICVAEEATIPLDINLLIGSNLDDPHRQDLKDIGIDEAISAMYTIHSEADEREISFGDILAGFIHNLTQRLALHDPTIRDWADHLSYLGAYGGIGRPIYASVDELTKSVVDRLRRDGCENERWSKWFSCFP